MRQPDITGTRFGRLLVRRAVPPSGKRTMFTWECVCDCGAVVTVRGNLLRKGQARCRYCVFDGEFHGEGPRGNLTPEYRAWRNMIVRCENPRTLGFRYYGERGIRVCERWRKSYANFLRDMGRRPSSGHSIDRIDNSGNYEPGNCRWASGEQQARNRRNVRVFEINGETLTIPEIAQRAGLSSSCLDQRLRAGWSSREAFTVPPGGRRGTGK